MSHDRTLIDAIKARFARKSSAQLQTIKADSESMRWSAEAVVAAWEILNDRKSGLAHEPAVPDDSEDAPPEYTYDPDDLALAFGLLSGLVTGTLVIPYTRRVGGTGREHPSPTDPQPDADVPAPFGPNVAWLAVSTADTAAVANAMGLRRLAPAVWLDGVEAAHRGSVFVTPPLGDWTLVVGTPLFHPPEQTATGVTATFESLGRAFEEVQYFSNLSDAGLFVWGQGQRGKVLRGYGWLGPQRRELWNVGAPTDIERSLGFRFDPSQPPMVEGQTAGELTPFAQEDLFQLASHWSIDPTALDVEFAEPVSGLLGKLPTSTAFERRRLA